MRSSNPDFDHPDVVHLVACPSEQTESTNQGRIIPTILCARALQQQHTPPGLVILIGDQSCEAQARRLGLKWHQRIAPPLSNPKLIHRHIKHLTKNASRVICWNDELGLLLSGIPAELDLISTLPKSASGYISRRVAVRVFEQDDKQVWLDRGQEATIDRLLPKVLDNLSESITPINRDHLNIQPNTMCVGVLADRPSDVDARELAFLLGLLNASGYSLTGVVPNTASHLAAARRHHRGLGSKFQFLITTDPITTLLPIFDVLIHPCFDGSGSSMLIERMCENADVPVLRLKQSARAGLSRAPGVAGPIIEQLDEMITAANSQTANPAAKPTHV